MRPGVIESIIRLRGLSAGAMIVLMRFVERHENDSVGAPALKEICSEAEIRPRSLNRFLLELESKGLLRSEQQIDPREKRKLLKRYTLSPAAEQLLAEGAAN